MLMGNLGLEVREQYRSMRSTLLHNKDNFIQGAVPLSLIVILRKISFIVLCGAKKW